MRPDRRNPRARRAAAAFALAAAAAASTGCPAGPAAGAATGAAPAAPAGPDAPAMIRAEGLVTTAPGATVTVGAEAGGRVVTVRVVEGGHVLRGEVLAALDSGEEHAALEEARARLAQSEAQLAFLERHYDRTDTLVHAGHVAIEELDIVARDRAVGRAQVAEAQATVDQLTAVLAKHLVRSPLCGRVVARTVDPGQMVVPGAPLFTIADLSRRRVEAEVDESDITLLRIGAPVAISADGYEDREWRGRIVSVPDQVVPSRLRPEDPTRPSDTRVILVKVEIPAAAPFKLGQRVELRIGVRRAGPQGADSTGA